MTENFKQRQEFLLDLKGQKVDKRSRSWIMYYLDAEELITSTYGHILTNVERQAELGSTLMSIGSAVARQLRRIVKNTEDVVLKGHVEEYLEKMDEPKEAHLAWFIFLAYLDTNVLSISLKRGKRKGSQSRKKHSSYHIQVRDSSAFSSIIETIDVDSVDLFPSKNMPDDWKHNAYIHSTGYALIKKKPHKDAIRQVKEGGMDYLVDTLNKLNRTGWVINPFVFDTFQKARFHTNKTPFKAMKEVDPIKRASLVIELEAIETLAERNKNNVFYHLYNVDFRGRIYPNTAFLHEQSSDNAKGLLLLDEAVPLGEEGYYWLAVHTANMFGNDKVSLDDRVQWVQDNFDILMGYVEDPMANDNWMDSDKPLCFLACCNELSLIQQWVIGGNDQDDFPSCLPVYIDGSNNGVQHLTAMSKDETVAPLVNLVPRDLPGDVYMYVAEKTIEQVCKDAADMGQVGQDKFEEVFTQLVELKADVAKYSNNTKSAVYDAAYKRLAAFGNANFDKRAKLGPVFWSKIKDKKIWRKTVKRPVMVLGYGGTASGMRTMVFEDTYDLSDYLRDKDKSWSDYLGTLIYDTCYKELPGPAKMLGVFEKLGASENEKGNHVAYRQVVTGFPVVQPYTETQTKEVELPYDGKTIRLNVQLKKDDKLGKRKQKQSSAPNLVHSVDAAHLTMVVHDAPYTATVVHDSFGCHAGNMSHMFMHVREKFVELYNLNPLEHIFGQMDATHLIPAKGNLDVSEVIKSDYAFA
jgi:DNA-directed RNA polymerase